MDVYLVATGPERFELYCESPDEPPTAPHPGPSKGLFRKLQAVFGRVLVAVEREHEREHARLRSNRQPQDGLLRRLRARVVRWLAERVAEQRLLWRLRGQERVRAFYPSGLGEARALSVIRQKLSSESDRHARWLAVDGIGLLFSALLMPVPGPNLFGYYFVFRVGGHFLAIRGARNGLRRVHWDLVASSPLDELARLGALPPAERLERARTIEQALGLCKLARFLERTLVQPA